MLFGIVYIECKNRRKAEARNKINELPTDFFVSLSITFSITSLVFALA
jgi:hypothetical protein